jgi:hypothetical protein
MQIDHTAAEPPNHGRICLAMSGWTRNSRNALLKMVPANRSWMPGVPCRRLLAEAAREEHRHQRNQRDQVCACTITSLRVFLMSSSAGSLPVARSVLRQRK